MSTASDEGDRIPMSQRERDRLRVLHSVLERQQFPVSRKSFASMHLERLTAFWLSDQPRSVCLVNTYKVTKTSGIRFLRLRITSKESMKTIFRDTISASHRWSGMANCHKSIPVSNLRLTGNCWARTNAADRRRCLLIP